MASHPPAQCCTIGVKHDGEPTGKMAKIAGVDAYVCEPSGSVHKDVAILYLPDVIGIWQNSKLMADQFAANGYYTVLLDILNGDPIPLNRPPGFDLMKWKDHGNDGKTPHTPEAVDPIVKAAVEYLKQTAGIKKIGAVGYCFGAKWVARFMAEGGGIDVGYCAHPSFVTEEELGAITGPFSISAAETDAIFTPELRHKSEVILKNTGLPYQINLYSGVSHGFAVRSAMDNKQEKFGKEQAFLQAVTWFDTHLLD